MHADLLQHGGNAQVWPDVFLAGRRVHDDQRSLPRARYAEITAETGVSGCRCNAVLAHAEVPFEPLAQQLETRIVMARGRRMRA